MRVTITGIDAPRNIHNVKALSVDQRFGRVGELVVLSSFDRDDLVTRISVYDWNKITIVKDMEYEKV